MIPQPFLPGYLVYLLFIFLPGIGVGELLGIWKIGDTFVSRVALAFGLGLSIDTLVFLIKTAGVDGLRGISVGVVYFPIAIGLLALLIALFKQRSFGFYLKLKTSDYVVLFMMLIIGLMLSVYFQKYPIFPEYFTQDPTNHVNYALGLISGSETSIPGGVLYYGIHYQLASGILLVGGEPLITVQRIMAILVILSPPMIYYATKSILDSGRAALVTTILYSLSGMIWFAGVFDSGLYPNFFGILASLFLIALIVEATRSKRSIWILLTLATINAYMSHYTFLTIVPALLVYPLVRFAYSRKTADLKNYVLPSLVVIVPAVVPFVVYPGLVERILYLAVSGGGAQAASTQLSNALSAIPVLSFLAVEIENDIALVVLFLLTAVFLYMMIRSKEASMSIPIIWFLSLLVTAPFNISAWRFSYEAIVPLTIMGGFALYSILPSSYKEKRQARSISSKVRAGDRSNLPSLIVFVILFAALTIGSWGQMMMGDALSSTSVVANSQVAVYDAIYWLKANTPNGSSYLSVSDWRFTYTNLLIGRSSYYSYVYQPSTAISLAKNVSANYILVTNLVTASVPEGSGLFPWNIFPTSSTGNLTLLYTNSDVRIYALNSSA